MAVPRQTNISRSNELTQSSVQTTPKQLKKVKTALDSQFSSLGGNAVSRDKRGRVTKDDAAMASELTAAGLGSGDGNEYTAYVYYEFEFP
jgi:V-type H+-transporting ATPase subunit C